VALCENKKYEAFGNLKWSSGTYSDNREFTSKEKDPTGFHYFGARYYSGDIGRFLSPDPISIHPFLLDLGHPQTLNPYVYCHNDPVNYLDPLGLDEVDFDEPEIYYKGEGTTVTAPRDHFDAYNWGSDYQFFSQRPGSSGWQEGWRSQSPDFFSLTGNIGIPHTLNLLGVSVQLTLDRYGNLYLGAGPTLGKALTLISGSVSAGNIMKTNLLYRMPTEAELSKFLTRHGFEFSGGSIIGVQWDYVPKTGGAGEYGFYSPQIGATYLYSKKLLKLK